MATITADALSALARELTLAALDGEPPLKYWQRMAGRLKDFFGCERATIFQRVSGSGRLVSRYAEGVIGTITLEDGEGVAGRAADTREPCLSNEPYADPRFARALDEKTGYRTSNLLAFPLIFHGEAVGVVELLNKPGGFTEEDVSAVRRLGAQLSVLFIGTRLQEQQEEITRQLVQSEKMAALGRMAGGVAHEINNPLAAILGFVDLMLREPGVAPETMANLLKIDAETRRIVKIVQNVLGLSRSPAAPAARVKLSPIMRDAAELVSHELRRRRVELVGPIVRGEEPEVLADPASLKQVFINLIMNAAQAMETTAPAEGSAGKLTLRVRAADGFAVAAVSDTGPGVAVELQDRLFEPFFTTKEAGKGTGLGLYVIKGIVERHGGRLTFENQQAGGAVFRVELPPAGGGAPRSTPSSA